MNRTATALLAVAVLALAGCSSGGSDAKPAVTRTVTKEPSATPSLSHAETVQSCSAAIADAAPGWKDWNFDPGAWSDDPRTPKVCLLLKDEADPSQGNRDFMGALIDGLNVADDPRASQ